MDEIMNTVDHCNKLISERRSVFPASYTDRRIDKDIILQILENANYAPTHRLTQPWRFKVMEGEKLIDLGRILADLYKEKMPADKFSEMKFKKTAAKPAKCSHVIAICIERTPTAKLK